MSNGFQHDPAITPQPWESPLREAMHCHADGDSALAAELYLAILHDYPHLSRVAYNLGNILKNDERYDEAENCFRQALEHEPEFYEALLNLSFVLQEQGKIEEALALCDAIVRRWPGLPDPRFNLACLRLLTGDFSAGWEGYEERFQCLANQVLPRHADLPAWNGVLSPGLRLLVHTEQGYGDAIQMSRYLHLLTGAGMRVWLETSPHLSPLFNGIGGLEGCLPYGGALPALDAQVPIMSLPLLFGTLPGTIPPARPFEIDTGLVGQMAALLPSSPGLRVGIAWAGRQNLPVNRKRSCPPQLIASLLDLPGVTFVSLQKENEPAFRLEDSRLIDLSGELHDFRHTAALIASLDLVITIDTAVAHLAGTMGKPAWLLLSFVADWRWRCSGSGSAWYPSMRLFRQPSRGDWETVIAAVREELDGISRPTAYVYRPGRDFCEPADLGGRTVPLVEGTDGKLAPGVPFSPLDSPEKASLLIFPYYLEHLTENRTIAGMYDLIGTLPLFSAREADHVFFSDHDSPARYHSGSFWFRASMEGARRDPSSFPLPYQTEDVTEYLHFDPERLRYVTSFVGYLGIRRQRAPLINAILEDSRLAMGLDLSDAFHGHQPEPVLQARRRRYLEISSQSLTILCPAGDGTNSIRFFETLALGRLPVLVSAAPLPFEDRIDYGRFVLRIPPSDTARAGALLHDWLAGVPDRELLERCREARHVWETWFSREALPGAIAGEISRHLLSRRHCPPHATHAHHADPDGNSLERALECLATASPAAEFHLREALGREPRNSRLYLLLGLFLKSRGRFNEAEGLLRDAILYDHRNFEAYLELGRLYAQTGRDREAIERFFEASTVRPESETPYRDALPLLVRCERGDEARFCMEQLRKLGTGEVGTGAMDDSRRHVDQ